MREYKEMCKYEAQSHNKKNFRAEQGAWKDGALDGLPEIHATVELLMSATVRIHTLQALRPGHENPEESELPNEW